MDIFMAVTPYQLNYCENASNLMIQKGLEGNETAILDLKNAGGSLWDAVYGLALGGHEPLVETMLLKHPELLSAAATGYAHAKNSKAIAKLNNQEKLKSDLIYGFSLAGDEKNIRTALKTNEITTYLPLIIKGLASTNQRDLLKEFLTAPLINIALKAAAKSGHHQLVHDLLSNNYSIPLKKLITEKGAVKPSFIPALNYVLQGYAEGRHFAEAAEILELGVNPMLFLQSLAPTGELDTSDANQLLSTIKEIEITEHLKQLMDEQFDFNLETLDLAENKFSPFKMTPK